VCCLELPCHSMALRAPPRVLLADDHAGILSALRRLLGPSCDVVGCVMDGAALLEAAARLKPDVIVIDIFMPKVNGLKACRLIREARPEANIVILTGSDDRSTRRRAFSAGASAFIPKHRMADDLLNAIHRDRTGG
jgi:DNA-binding NarL/FixJ family response regulator